MKNSEIARVLGISPSTVKVHLAHMNDKSGIHSREILAELQDTPAIIVTGSGSEAVAAQAMRLGAYDYLIKDAAPKREEKRS